MPQSEISHSHMDRGYAWVIVFVASINNFVIIGLLKSIGVLYVALYQTFNMGRGEAAIISVTCAGMLHGMGLISTALLYKLGYKKLTLVGTSIAFLGVFLSYFVQNGTQLLITFGVIQGIGIGLATTPNISIPSQYFLKHRAKANGITFAACSLGSTVLPPFIEFLVEKYDLRGAFLIISGVSLHTVVASLLIRDPPKKVNHRRNDISDKDKDKSEVSNMIEDNTNSEKKTTVTNSCTSINNEPKSAKSEESYPARSMFISSFKNGYFYAFIISTQAMSFALVVYHAIMPAHAISHGVATADAPYLISIASISDLVGRLTIGYVVDKRFVQLSTSYGLSMVIAAMFIAVVGVLPKQSFVELAIFSTLYSIGYGSCQLHGPVVISHYMSPDRLPVVLSSCALIAVIPIFVSAPISTYFYETYGKYSGVFLIMSLLFALPALGWLIHSMVFWMRSRNSQKKTENLNESEA